MQVETTGLFFDGTCEVQTAWCYARECGALTAVTTVEATQINVCGACLEEMVDTRAWQIPGTRPLPWSARAGELPPPPSLARPLRRVTEANDEGWEPHESSHVPRSR